MNKFLKAAQKRAARASMVAAGLAVAGMHSAMAAGVDISADVTQAKTDIGTNGGLIIGVVVAIAAFGWVRRIIK
jgi:hypothetical protein